VCGKPLEWQRSTRRFCGAACKQAFYQQRLSSRVRHRRTKPRVAFGHVIRQQHTTAPVAETTLAKATVRSITLSAAKESLYEPMPAVSTAFYGLFIGDQLAAAVVFGPDPIANLRHRYNGSTIALLRGGCAPWAPRAWGRRPSSRSTVHSVA
jgi:hypothetical protein